MGVDWDAIGGITEPAEQSSSGGAGGGASSGGIDWNAIGGLQSEAPSAQPAKSMQLPKVEQQAYANAFEPGPYDYDPALFQQTSPSSFDLGATIGEFQKDPQLASANAVIGAPYGLMQLGDALGTIGGFVPRQIEHLARGDWSNQSGMGGALTESSTPLTDWIFPNRHAQEYREQMQKLGGEAFMPGAFRAGGMVAQAALPAGSAAQAGTLGKAALTGALENAGMSAVSNIGEQMSERGRVEPGELLAATAIGTGLGAGLSSAGYGINKLLGRIPGIPSASEKILRGQVSQDVEALPSPAMSPSVIPSSLAELQAPLRPQVAQGLQDTPMEAALKASRSQREGTPIFRKNKQGQTIPIFVKSKPVEQFAPQVAGGLATADLMRDHEGEPDWQTDLRMLGEGAVAAGTLVGGSKLLKNNARLGKYFRDSVARVGALDDALQTDTAKTIFDFMGAIHARNFGLKIDPDLRAHAVELLRRGDEQGLAALNLDAAQETAIRKSFELEQELKYRLDEQVFTASDAIQQMQQQGINTRLEEDGLKALKGMAAALGPRNPGDTGLEEDYAAILRRMFDYHFYAQLPFELLNLSDLAILSTGKTGIRNMFTAVRDLGPGGNRQLKQHFEHSNLAGGFTAEKTQAGGASGVLQKSPRFNPFKADKVNADRTALAAMYQFKRDSAIPGSEQQFAADLIEGNLDAQTTIEAWSHVAETLSRTLGADPVKINMDVISSSGSLAKAVGTFIRQPARTTSLLVGYAQDNKYAALLTTVGMMALIGGDSAIPKDVQEVWKKVDPSAYFRAASLLNEVNVPSKLTGRTLSGKTKYSVAYPLSAVSDPSREQLMNSLQKACEAIAQIQTDGVDGRKALSTLAAVTSVLSPIVARMPAKQFINTGKAVMENTGIPGGVIPGMAETEPGKKIYYFSDDLTAAARPYSESEVVPLQELGIDPMQNVAGSFLPGEWSSIYERQRAKEEEALTGQQRYFQERQQQDPLSQLLRSFVGR